MGIVKIIKKILLGVLVFMLISMGIIFTLVSLNKDEIIDYFVNQANKQISTPIEVGKIDISLFNHFPNISIDLQDVTIKESYKGNKGVLGKAENISFAFSLFDLINKNYEINGLHITEANVDLKINNTGLPNYLIFKKDSTSKGSMFSINNITASDLTVNYIDVKSDVDLNFIIKKARSRC
jgi:uncharacterized protein involved in outer membrane biogenesis